jgi:small-conductance mechanosensitive channel
MKFWDQLLRDNGIGALALGAAIAVAAFVALWLARTVGARLISRFAQSTARTWDDGLADAANATRLWLLLPLALYAGVSALQVPARLDQLLHHVAMVGVIAQVAVWANRLLVFWLTQRMTDKRATDPAAATTVTLIGFVARTFVWTLALLIALDQLGFNVTALITGLGIGGVAVALAVQNILGDLFASAAIVLDKPFVIGDFIVVGEFAGSVEKVGLKTTRVRSLSGEQLVFGNAQLLGSQIRNYKRMQERRILFGIGVTYETPLEKLRALPGWLREAVEAQPGVRFDRAHFKEYADFSLNYEIVYYVLSPDYGKYMDVQQAINLAIFDKCAREGVQFAYPTRTLYLKQEAADGR